MKSCDTRAEEDTIGVQPMRPNPRSDKRSTARRRVCTALAAIAVSGCAVTAVHTAADFERGDAAAEKLARDADSCAKQAEAHQKEHGFGPYDPTHGSYNWMYDSCMQAGGYQRSKPQ
jgi:hypothetical protein